MDERRSRPRSDRAHDRHQYGRTGERDSDTIHTAEGLAVPYPATKRRMMGPDARGRRTRSSNAHAG